LFAWIVAIGRRGTNRTIHPKRVEFQRPESYRKLYERHFQCPVKFDARHNMPVFSKADLDKPFLTYHAELLALVAPQLEAELTPDNSHKKQSRNRSKEF
jgi:hypothetical protein